MLRTQTVFAFVCTLSSRLVVVARGGTVDVLSNAYYEQR
jgi:hypothetical protein